MSVFMCILLGLLLVCAISVTFSKNLLNSILIFMAYSLVMSIIWILLESPDLAITEAAVGAGVTSILFFITLKKIHGVLNNPEEETQIEDDADDDANTALKATDGNANVKADEATDGNVNVKADADNADTTVNEAKDETKDEAVKEGRE